MRKLSDTLQNLLDRAVAEQTIADCDYTVRIPMSHQVDSLKKVVYVKNRFSFKEREVTLGLSSQKEAVVTEGLSEGDVISLLKPKKK